MKKQICKNCAYYSAYYKQWSDHYGRLNHGFCSRYSEAKTQSEVCECYKGNEQKKQLQQKRMFVSLETALNDINAIAQILKEQASDKKEFF